MMDLETLNVAGCVRLTELPSGTRIRRWIEVARCGLRKVPWSSGAAEVRWNGVAVPDWIAFCDLDELSLDDVLTEPDPAGRRVLVERVGLAWLIDRGGATLLDRDRDAGGERQLLRLDLSDGEPLVCVDVRCPSTGHRHVLRVPPEMRTCHQAIAWTAGFSSSRDYRPTVET
jgi:hypothetical protein